ncbi:hypothetical protein Dimus_011002 [Dionaea muscipula]
MIGQRQAAAAWRSREDEEGGPAAATHHRGCMCRWWRWLGWSAALRSGPVYDGSHGGAQFINSSSGVVAKERAHYAPATCSPTLFQRAAQQSAAVPHEEVQPVAQLSSSLT